MRGDRFPGRDEGGFARSIRTFPILAGERGQQPCDLAALAELVARVSEPPLGYPEIAESDLNPVFAGPDGAWWGCAHLQDINVTTKLDATEHAL